MKAFPDKMALQTVEFVYPPSPAMTSFLPGIADWKCKRVSAARFGNLFSFRRARYCTSSLSVALRLGFFGTGSA